MENTEKPVSEAEIARKLFAQTCDFVLAAAVPEHFPDTLAAGALPEIGLIGRSNVGKSSLINALTGRKRLARASCTPGRTQQIIFFNLGQRLMLVDLPGYGHASAPDEVKTQWNGLVRCYIQKRPTLRLMLLLLDGRHGALARDHEMMDMLDKAAISYQVVLTKMDQVRGDNNVRATVEALIQKHPAARPALIATSAEKRDGIPELQQLMNSFAEPPRVYVKPPKN